MATEKPMATRNGPLIERETFISVLGSNPSRIRFSRLPIGPDIGAAAAACLADERPLDIGKPDLIRPPIAADRAPMAAPEIRAIDQEAANARSAHFTQRNLLLATICGTAAGEGGHASLKRG
jgi:hypothetical protein